MEDDKDRKEFFFFFIINRRIEWEKDEMSLEEYCRVGRWKMKNIGRGRMISGHCIIRRKCYLKSEVWEWSR